MENIIVLCGGRSAEHEISIISARAIIKGLNESGYKVQVLGIKKDGSSFTSLEISETLSLPSGRYLDYPECKNWISWLSLLENNNTVVFPVLHGPYGEDGTVQGLLELLGLAYVGAGVSGSAVGMNKIHTKEILKSHGLPVLPWITVHRSELENGKAETLEPECPFDFPVFVKPANMGSSVGISKAANRETLGIAIREALRYDEYVLVEKGINAREIEISVLGNRPAKISVPGEIIPCGEFYSYEAKYLSEESRLIIPAPLDNEQLEKLQLLASDVFLYLQLEGMARIDFLLDKDTGEIWVNEPNTIPGFTRISMYPKLWEATGMPFPELMKNLVLLAQDRKSRRSKLEVTR